MLSPYMLEVLVSLVNINTSKENKNEISAAVYLKNELDKLSVRSRLYEPKAGKCSIVAVLPGKEKQSIILHSHIDTAGAGELSKWKVDPFKATHIGSRIYGRGALDCKGLIAVWMKILECIVKNKIILNKTLIFVAAADEEDGGQYGTEWILKNTEHFDDAYMVIGEGGGYPLTVDKEKYITVQTGEREEICVSMKKYDYTEPEENCQRIVNDGINAGFYNSDTLDYIVKCAQIGESITGRKIPAECFFKNIADECDKYIFLSKLPWIKCKELHVESDEIIKYTKTCKPYGQNLNCLKPIQNVFQKLNLNYRLLPFITPGYSDNRHFRINNIDTIGFFPLAEDNNIYGIHKENEYITENSLKFALTVLIKVIEELNK